MLAKKEWLPDPQRWNRYAYVRNNPLKFIDPHGEDLVIYLFYGNDLSDDEKEFLKKYKKQIEGQIVDKYKNAGIDKVHIRDGGSLTKEQIADIQKNTPAGVALLEFDNLKQGGNFAGNNVLGGNDPDKTSSAVFLGNLIRDEHKFDSTTAFRAGEVASHEIGHAIGFEAPDWMNIPLLNINFASWARSNIMDENQGIPTRMKYFDTKSDRNQRVIQEINKIGDNTPKP